MKKVSFKEALEYMRQSETNTAIYDDIEYNYREGYQLGYLHKGTGLWHCRNNFSIDEALGDWYIPEPKRLLYRRPVLVYGHVWQMNSGWYISKEQFMEEYDGNHAYGPWETMEEPEVCKIEEEKE